MTGRGNLTKPSFHKQLCSCQRHTLQKHEHRGDTRALYCGTKANRPNKGKATTWQRDKDLTGVKALPVAADRQAAQRQGYYAVER